METVEVFDKTNKANYYDSISQAKTLCSDKKHTVGEQNDIKDVFPPTDYFLPKPKSDQRL